MKSVIRIALFALCVLLQADATTYRLALKNGTIVQFQQYRVAGQVVYYTDKDDREVGVPLADIDMDRTRRLNAAASPPLRYAPHGAYFVWIDSGSPWGPRLISSVAYFVEYALLHPTKPISFGIDSGVSRGPRLVSRLGVPALRVGGASAPSVLQTYFVPPP